MNNNDIIWGWECLGDVPVSVTETQAITEEEYALTAKECTTLAEGLALILGLVNVDHIKNHCTNRHAECIDAAVEYINSLQITNVQMRN